MDNFIEVYKNVLSDEFCNKVINYFNIAHTNGFTQDRQSIEKVPKLEKQDQFTFLPSYPLHHTTPELINEFNKVFWSDCYSEYAKKYNIVHTLAQHKSYTMKIQLTKPGQGYHVWHAEATDRDSSNRVLVWTAYLNDDFEAGETEFLYQQYRYKPSKGDVVIFPAAFTHTHRGNPPIGGDKYIITGWIEF